MGLLKIRTLIFFIVISCFLILKSKFVGVGGTKLNHFCGTPYMFYCHIKACSFPRPSATHFSHYEKKLINSLFDN